MRAFTNPSELRRLVREGLGPGCRVFGVERLRGGSKEGVYRLALTGLAVTLDHMAAHTSPADHTSEDVTLTRALDDLTEAAARDPRINAAANALTHRLHELHTALTPRATYSLVHGELGPDHVLLAPDAHPVLIDIESLTHSDPEQEHAYLRLRFGPRYAPLSRPDLDSTRLSLHTLALHLSLVAGPLRLLDGDFPHREAMRGIAEHNTRGEALRLVSMPGSGEAGT